jgi:hypothetical protein
MLTLILLLAGFILFVLATIGVPAPARCNWVPAGLACWVLTALIAAWPGR